MPPHVPDNGSIHGMSLLVGELKAAIEHLNNNWKMKDAEAMRHRERLAEKFEELHDTVHEMKGSVEAVQQDVAEMKNDMSDAQVKLDAIEANRPTVMAAVVAVDDLKKFRDTLELRQQRALGWWDFIRCIGGVGWTIIGSVAAAALALLGYWLQKRL